MRARLRDSACLLITIALAFAATVARAGELLVMPYTCSVVGGEVVLNRAPDEGHRIVSRRQDRDFTACSPVDTSMCRKWTVHSFDIECGGERVPWTSVVAAADKERSAWVENGRLQIRMPPWWTAGRRAQPGDEIVQMPYGFAPKFGIDAIFVADEGQSVAGAGRGPAPQVGGYSSRMAPGASPPGRASDIAQPKDSEFAVAPGSALPPLSATPAGASSQPSARQSRDIPFEIKPPEEGLTVESAAAPPPALDATATDTIGPRPEHTFTSVDPEPEPAMTWSEPPPLPEQLDPSLRHEMARGSDTGGPSATETDETEIAQAAVVPEAPVAPLSDPATPAAPAIINIPPAAGGSAASGSQTTSPISAETASSQASAPGQQSGVESSSADTDAAVDAASTASDAPAGAAGGDASQVAAGTLEQLPAFSNEANAPDRTDPQGLMARVLSGEPAAVAVAVIAGGLLAILILGLSLTRRRQADLPDLASRDISSVSLEKGSHRAQPSPGMMMHDLGAPTLDAAAARVPAMSTPSLSVAGDDVSPRRRSPALAATHARRDPGASWGEAIPRTHAEALRVLGMGVTREASPASIKKVVDGLRMSWHPDYAESEADRGVRELRMKQINAAWEIISGTRAQQPEPQPARRTEKLHQL